MLASPHSQLPATARFILGLVMALAICFGLQAICYYVLDAGTGKGESNYFSTLSRFQAAAQGPAEIAFAGSSITGRMPGREVGNEHIANLGSDGGPPLDGIRMLVNRRIPQPRWLVVETNTLYGGVGFGESLIARNAASPWFSVGARLPLLAASARPTAMIYSALLRRQKILTGQAFPIVPTEMSPSAIYDVKKFSPDELERLAEYQDGLRLLHQSGVKIALVNFPAGPMNEIEKLLTDNTILVLSQELRVPYLDLAKQIPRDDLHFSDSVHLAPESAARILESIEKFCYIFDNMDTDKNKK